MENLLKHRLLFSKRLSYLIKCNGLSNTELARAIKVSPGLITKYTSAKASPSYENFIQLADYFCVSMDFLRGKHYHISDDPIKSNNMDYWMELIEMIRLNEVEEKEVFEYLRLLINNLN
ncbi:helix-turn-helix domain-containing protein [Cytobacillus firmus]|uniref:helix-turn-helix domain-containing protein n=1 Tax=Cytobacillus firmus TaxID=1399 RepID=UPI0034A2A22D